MPSPDDLDLTTDDITNRSSNPLSFQIASHSLTILCVVLGVYAFSVGVSVLRGALPPNVAHFLIALVPLASALWFGFGFMQSPPGSPPDFGLLLLCAGWGLAALSLWVPSSADGGANVTATVCGVLGLLCIVLGSVLSLRAWIDIVRS